MQPLAAWLRPPASVALLALGVTGQQWRLVESGGAGAARGGMAFDERRGELVRFGGEWARDMVHEDTRVFDGGRWLPRPAAVPGDPTGLQFHRAPILMTWDSVRSRVLLCNEASRDLWEWDGAAWTQRPGSPRPPLGEGRAFAFDRARGRAVLCTPASSATWEWDGTSWTVAASAGLSTTAATFVPLRGRVVSVGIRDLFEWNGAAWTQITNGLLPVAVQPEYAMAYDGWRQRLVIVNTAAAPVAVHEWDGVNLVSSSPANGPAPRRFATAVFDPSRGMTVLCGGGDSYAGFSDAWGWDGLGWTELAVAPAAGAAALAYDSTRNRLVAAGATAFLYPVPGTWERDASGWHRIATPSSPLPGAMVFDSVRNQTLMCEANGPIGPRIWNGVIWSLANTAPSPSPRTSFAVAFDAARGEAVLFGGSDNISGPLLADTWLWNGIAWRTAAPAAVPAPRLGHALAYDAGRQRTVLFGGATSSAPLNDTWEWDGINWLRQSPLLSPPARSGHAMAYDSARGFVTTTGGRIRLQIQGSSWTLWLPVELWDWDGTQWRNTPIANAPLRCAHAMAFDAARGRLVIQGGLSATMMLSAPSVLNEHTTSDTLELVTTGAAALPGGATCPAGVTAPRLRGESLPFTGNLSFALALTGGTPGSLAILGTGQPGLPTPLGSGCLLALAAPMTTVVQPTNAGGAARWPLPIPDVPVLRGVLLSAQAAVIGPAGQAFTTELVTIQVGE